MYINMARTKKMSPHVNESIKHYSTTGLVSWTVFWVNCAILRSHISQALKSAYTCCTRVKNLHLCVREIFIFNGSPFPLHGSQ
jgi:hypothetical protein